jgi:hypothetical protein
MKPQLVITDLDATLIVKHQMLSPRAKKAIETLQAHGVYFGIASGRPVEQITPSLEEWGITTQVILAFNGCHLLDCITNQKYEYYPMKAQWIKETFELMKPFHVVPNIVVDGINYFGEDMHFPKISNFPIEIVEDPSFYWVDTPKIMWRLYDEADMPKIEAYLAEHPSPYYQGFKTGPGLIEIANRQVSKGFALKEFCRMENIDIANVIALGDTSNDNELLQAAGCGVCMKNGSDDTKAIADAITEKTCDEDGWADYIEKNVLIPNGWM